MMSRIRLNLQRFISIGCFILILSFMGGCATLRGTFRETFRGKPPEVEEPKPEVPKVEPPPSQQVFPNFIAVVAREGDTFSSLASKYLKDPSMDWFIAEFNEMETLTPGQPLIIPLKP